jgi:hypothetical protein
MTGADAIQALVILTLMVVSYRWFWTSKDRFLRKACVIDRSFVYDVTHTGSMFVPSFDHFISEGAEIYIPTGDGLYAKRVKNARRIAYRDGLIRWLKEKRAIVHIVVTVGEEALQEWQGIKDAYPNQLHVYFLRPELALGPEQAATKARIERLHTFHPVMLVNPVGSKHSPGAMWIEHNHPLGSKFAYHTEWIIPKDAANDPRFEQYRAMYVSLLDGPHVQEIRATEMSNAVAA